MGVLEIFDGCIGDIYWFPGDIRKVSWRYLISVMELFDRRLGVI